MYIYPDNLRAKATLWLWELRDIGIIGIGLIVSVFGLIQLKILLPLVLTVLFAFISIQHNGICIRDFLRYGTMFFIAKPQLYEWSDK